MERIAYRDGFLYQLAETYTIQTSLYPQAAASGYFLTLTTSGALTIREGYAWDGPSGPAIDTKNFMRGSLVHDALYQIMREGHLDELTWREMADLKLYEICIDDGMSRPRAWWVYYGLRFGGRPAANPKNRKTIIFAP